MTIKRAIFFVVTCLVGIFLYYYWLATAGVPWQLLALGVVVPAILQENTSPIVNWAIMLSPGLYLIL